MNLAQMEKQLRDEIESCGLAMSYDTIRRVVEIWIPDQTEDGHKLQETSHKYAPLATGIILFAYDPGAATDIHEAPAQWNWYASGTQGHMRHRNWESACLMALKHLGFPPRLSVRQSVIREKIRHRLEERHE